MLSYAEELVQKIGLRTLDAVHVASALTFQAALGRTIPFAGADAGLYDVALSMIA